jgi:CMP-N,N'-diacetyllegionaminic acid synthase
MSVHVHLIARLESQRVRRKNLRMLHGKPLLSWAIEAAKSARGIDRVFLNTESERLADLARSHGIEVFFRDPALAADDVVLDQTTYAFAKAHPADTIGMVNPVCPLTTGADIEAGLARFVADDLDTLLTVREEQLHAFLGGKPINIDVGRRIPMTQDLVPVQLVTWNFCFWKRAAFVANYEANGFGVFTGRIGLLPLDKRTAVKISDEADFRIAEALLAQRTAPASPPEFWDGGR